ncbi:hypothetical protein BS78_08G053100 [Paspalum vaginatum]|nr:hypothetical protein BS78_08G053100 [Paspalum vaginatum]
MATEPQASTSTIHHLILLLTVAAVSIRAASMDDTAAATAPSAADSRSAASAFLRASCATTLYPSLCHDSLLPYASEFQTSHPRLARAAAGVAAAHLRSLSACVKDILRHGHEPEGGGGRPSETAALRDCASTISTAANLAEQSSAELTKLEPAAGGCSSRQARWVVDNAKTWLSAAMTNEGTCADGLDEGGGATAVPAGKEVMACVASVRQYTSNALALVNGIQL